MSTTEPTITTPTVEDFDASQAPLEEHPVAKALKYLANAYTAGIPSVYEPELVANSGVTRAQLLDARTNRVTVRIPEVGVFRLGITPHPRNSYEYWLKR